MKLILVESPTKARTLTKYLGKEYQIEATMGHIRDLPKSVLGVDILHDFAPTYIIPTAKKKRVSELKKIAANPETNIHKTLTKFPKERQERISNFLKKKHHLQIA